MNCLHICSGDLWAGAEVSACSLMTELASRPGCAVTAIVLNPGPLERRLRDGGVHVELLPESSFGLPAIVTAGSAVVRRLGPAVIHTHRYKENVIGSFLSAMHGIPHVRSVHGLPPPLGWNGRPRGLGPLFDDALGDWTGGTWIAVTADLARRISGVRRRVHVVPNGLHHSCPAPDRPRLERAFGDGGRAWYVGFAGRLEPVKGPDRFLRVFSRLPDEVGGRAVRGIVLGEGSMRGSLEALVETLGIGSRLRLLGHQEEADRCIAAMDVLVLPSDHEGHPMVLLEAMRSGVPVVAAGVGGVPEILGDAEWVVPPGAEEAMASRIVRLLESSEDRNRWSGTMKCLFQDRFTIEIAADRVLEIYEAA